MGATAPKVSQNKSPGKTFKRVGSQSNGTLLRKSLIVKPSFWALNRCVWNKSPAMWASQAGEQDKWQQQQSDRGGCWQWVLLTAHHRVRESAVRVRSQITICSNVDVIFVCLSSISRVAATCDTILCMCKCSSIKFKLYPAFCFLCFYFLCTLNANSHSIENLIEVIFNFWSICNRLSLLFQE